MHCEIFFMQQMTLWLYPMNAGVLLSSSLNHQITVPVLKSHWLFDTTQYSTLPSSDSKADNSKVSQRFESVSGES